ncbi:DUF6797 domain-containing protein [Seonamhaeicola sp.]|uniref:DUF6797 domain-containing protein n=1 Tax=Seonamhaeicola sp. TaxID=1912245 RepID=UPI0026343EEC|nr:DUF6797 domain-containing protein [Seonamhaeicola sp.]
MDIKLKQKFGLKKLERYGLILMNKSLLAVFFSMLLVGCERNERLGSWDFQVQLPEEEEGGQFEGVLKIKERNSQYHVSLVSFEMETIEFNEVSLVDNQLDATFIEEGDASSEEDEDDRIELHGAFSGENFNGALLWEGESLPISAIRQSNAPIDIDRSNINYTLSAKDLSETEQGIDHQGIIGNLDGDALFTGAKIYNSNCINCHGTPEMEGSLPTATKFWQQALKAGNDPYSMYETISRGYGAMPPQLSLTPKQKYGVLAYIREQYVKKLNPREYFKVTEGYLRSVPMGTSTGPEEVESSPWAEQDYGNFFMNTIEVVDEKNGPERFHSPGPVPYEDEDYTKNNFAYKGIAVRLDKGDGGVAKGNTWMIFDHDLMRVAGGWTGQGFIDWNGILLNAKHETYPRTVGELHFETPVGPGWANPKTGSFNDNRYKARDGRRFGPLPKSWANYKGLYHYNDHIVFSYSVGDTEILEEFDMLKKGGQTIFIRTFNISDSKDILKLRVASDSKQVRVTGKGASLVNENGFVVLKVAKSGTKKLTLFIANVKNGAIDEVVSAFGPPRNLVPFTKGGNAHYPEVLSTSITKGAEDKLFAIDQLTPPFDNPWNCRMKFSGIDFMNDSNKAVLCTTDGDVLSVEGLTKGSLLKWRRIAAGLFQPLGVKVINDSIYVSCRDQIVRLQDLNGDGETDFYESFNHDHQVTDHFHEFAMGLQSDKAGNLYYAKSGRHAREALIPQHGTLIKVSKDGQKSEIIANGFRAANGVCINPDGSFLVTDQEGYWNPANRINWVDPNGSNTFYGNLWSYNPPKDTTRTAMVKPMVWVDMEFDRSPSELLWVDSKKWKGMNGGLLSFSYGYGKIQLVLHENVKGQMQGGVIDIPGIRFYTGVMRGRFHPDDENLYLCGMSAWSTSSNERPGDLYRIRYTGNPIPMPIKLNATKDGMRLVFAEVLDLKSAADISNYTVNSWNFLRTSDYGSDRYNEKELKVVGAKVLPDNKSVELIIDNIKPVDAMTIKYKLKTEAGFALEGTIQNTIHTLPD